MTRAVGALAALALLAGASAYAQVDGGELTPDVQQPSQWAVIGGADFEANDGTLNKFSKTPFTVDFFSTSFSPDGSVGLFGGWECPESTAFGDLGTCARRPTVYRLYTDENGDTQLDEVALPGADRSGFVGAISWIDSNRALVVGGTGKYPRRERPAVAGGDAAYAADDREHGAGEARAWLYESGSWTEITDTLPAEMGALTAVGCAPPGSPAARRGTCVAGGMQQLWWWRPATADKPEGFQDLVTSAQRAADPPGTNATPIADFHFRVREVRFHPEGGSDVVGAVTSGCCTPTTGGSIAGGRFLFFSNGQWSSQPATGDAPSDELADSFYDLAVVGQSTGTAIASPGGEADGSGDEPGSRIVGAGTSGVKLTNPDIADAKLSSLRLLAADGDFVSTTPPGSWRSRSHDEQKDTIPDWAVGRLKASEQGIAYSTIPSVAPLPNPLTCDLQDPRNLNQNDLAQCEPRPGNVTGNDPTSSRRLVGFPTYALNSFEFVPASDGTVAWAVGDRGAIVRLGGAGRLTEGEPAVPTLGDNSPTPLSDMTPWDPFRPALDPAEPGKVPAVVQRPLDDLERPAITAWGTADPTRWDRLKREAITAIAASRDGSEAWAVGSGDPYNKPSDAASGDAFAIQHFDGERWVRCDADGLGGRYEPDPACASLHALLVQRSRDDFGQEFTAPPSLSTITRVPLERDDEASNNDEFAAVAVGGGRTGVGDHPATILNYVGGRWQVDRSASEVVKIGSGQITARIAFVRPDDGWLVTTDDNGQNRLYHYGGGDWPNGKWTDCRLDQATRAPECGENATIFPLQTQGENLQLQVAGDTVLAAGMRKFSQTSASDTFPYVLSKKAGEGWVREYDPACNPETNQCSDTDTSVRGRVFSLSGVDLGDGKVSGWLLGHFPYGQAPLGAEPDDATKRVNGPTHVLMRRDPDKPPLERWTFRQPAVRDAADYYIPLIGGTGTSPLGPKLVSFAQDGAERSFILPGRRQPHSEPYNPPLEYDAKNDRWRVMETPFVSSARRGQRQETTQATVVAGAPDSQGGLWLAAEQPVSQSVTPIGQPDAGVHHATFFYRYSGQRHRDVFDDAPHPITEPLTDLAGSPDGTVWVSTESDRLYRYDRLGGWERTRIRGWDPGRVVTRPSRVLAVAVNDAGTGLAVGEAGRIADLSRDDVRLDRASGKRCGDPPCGAARDLHAAAVAPDGSALAGGDRTTLLWRPAGGDFRTVNRPGGSARARITGLSMPDAGHAWLTTDTGEVWAGTLVGSDWRWVREVTASMVRDERGRARLNAVEIDSSGRGLAVGDRGALVERSPDGSWRSLRTGYLDNLYSIALPPGGYRDGTLIGGGIGLVLTRVDGDFHVARRSDITDPLTAGPGQRYAARIVGLALSRTPWNDGVEAWAASQQPPQSDLEQRNPPGSALLHFGSTEDPLLHQRSRAKPLPDAPDPVEGEITLAAFGRSECQLERFCPEYQGTNLFNEVVSRRIRAALIERRKSARGPFAAVFTGDISTMPGRTRRSNPQIPTPNTALDENIVHAQWRDLVANPLADKGVPLFAALGKLDLARATTCAPGDQQCPDTQNGADAGASLPWRTTFADMSGPWGLKPPIDAGDVQFVPVEDGSGAAAEAPGGGARTHYALDVVRGGKRVLRLVFFDNSFARSLTAAEGSQNPVEGDGGQSGWLERVLCIRGETCTSGGTRTADQPAVVVSNTPTYSYGPGGLEATQTDGSVLETILVRHRATGAIAGRLGWNGLYYTLAAGLHYPCVGDPHPDPNQKPPEASDSLCAEGASDAPTDEAPSAPGASELAEALRDLGAPLPPAVESTIGTTEGLQRAMPTLVSASAGGRFGPEGTEDGTASAGFWHGYGIMRIRPDGGVIVEQRPVFDYVGIEAGTHTLQPGQSLTLRGFGREPMGTDVGPRMARIDSPAITHRYDLVEADPEKPWLPKVVESRRNSRNPHGYVQIPPGRDGVATIDSQTGRITTGKAKHGRIYALAILSVGDKSASWPLVFEPRKSYVAPDPPRISVPSPPTLRPPALRVLSAAAAPPPPTSPPPTTPPITANLTFPQLPTLPTIPTATAAPTTPPVPPPVPPPPPQQTGSALNLNLDIAGINVTPPAAPVPQPAPPINPAPPGGARKEAKQKQAAVAKSEEGSSEGEGGVDPSDAQARVNEVNSPNSYTRTDDPAGGRHAFTAASHREQPSAWATGLRWGGGLGLGALVLALGFTTLRPTPRRRTPDVPAPAYARIRNDSRR